MTIKVLLVQRQNHARRLFKHLLSSLECTVTQVESIDNALDRCRRESFDLVFVDEGLEGERHGDAVRALRGVSGTSGALVVALVDRSGERQGAQLVASGADDYMVLPAPLEDVQTRLRMVVSLARRLSESGAGEARPPGVYDRFFDAMPDPAFVLDRVGTIVAANQRLADLTGYTIPQLVGQPAEFIGLPMAEEIPQFLAASASSPGDLERVMLVRRDMKPVSVVARYAWLDRQTRDTIIGVARETGETAVQSEPTEARVERRQVAFEFDRRGVVRNVTPELARILGTTRERLVGRSLRDLVHGEDFEVIPRVIASVHSPGETCESIRLRAAGGAWEPFEMLGRVIKDTDGSERYLMTVGDVGRDVLDSSTLDPMTGLPDRQGFTGAVELALRDASSNQLVAIIFLNVDHFKQINERYGYNTGDRMIANLARRLESLVNFGEVLCRIGGDEFAILASSSSSHAEALRFAERINHDLSTRPFQVDGVEVFLTASIGIAVGEVGSVSPVELLSQADSAATSAKRSGRGRINIYEPRLARTKSDRLVLEQDLMQALRRNELVTYYQPEVDLRTGAIVGVEALVRWNHPKHGLISPARFIPSAESAGLIDPISRWVLEDATQRVSEWVSRFQLEDFGVAVNISAGQFRNDRLISDVSGALRRSGLAPARLRAEITESVLAGDEPDVVRRMHQLRKLGVHLAIDDFGTGYASFSYLRSLPVNQLKVDRSFVSGSGATSGELSLTRSMAKLARDEGLDLVVEGIESTSQLKRVLELGCTRGQGYYFSRPVGPETIEFLLMAGPFPFANLVNGIVGHQDRASSAATS